MVHNRYMCFPLINHAACYCENSFNYTSVPETEKSSLYSRYVSVISQLAKHCKVLNMELLRTHTTSSHIDSNGSIIVNSHDGVEIILLGHDLIIPTEVLMLFPYGLIEYSPLSIRWGFTQRNIYNPNSPIY